MFEYSAKVESVTDGDTLVLSIDLGFEMFLTGQSCRLFGLDAPESRTSDLTEKVFGELSKSYVKRFVEDCNNKVIVRTILDKSEKFGRILVTVINPTTQAVLNEELIANKLAVKYNGEAKALIKEAHLKNRRDLIMSGKVVAVPDKNGVVAYLAFT